MPPFQEICYVNSLFYNSLPIDTSQYNILQFRHIYNTSILELEVYQIVITTLMAVLKTSTCIYLPTAKLEASEQANFVPSIYYSLGNTTTQSYVASY